MTLLARRQQNTLFFKSLIKGISFLIFYCLLSQMLYASWFDNTISKLFSFNVPKNILELVNKNIPGNLQAKSIEYILPNKIKITDLQVIKDNKEIVLAGKNIELSISLPSLLTKNIIIKEALIDGLFFNYKILKGSHNVIDVFSDNKKNDKADKSSLRISIANVDLKNATFEMEHDSGVSIFAQNISVQGNFWIEKGPFLVELSKVLIPQGAISAAGLDLPLSNMKVEGLLISDKKVYAKNLQCLYENSPLNASGTVFIDEDYYDVKAYLNRLGNKWPTGLPKLFFLPPSFEAKIDLSGKLADPLIKVDIITKNTQIKSLNIDSIKSKVVVSKDAIIVNEADIITNKKTLIKALGKVDLNDKKYDFKANINNIQSQEIVNFLEISLDTSGVISTEALINGDYNKNHIINLAFNGVMNEGKIWDIKLSNKTFFNTNLQYDFSSLVNIKNAEIKNNNSTLNFLGKIYGDNKPMQFTYKANIKNINQYLSVPSNLNINNIYNNGKIIVDKKRVFIESLLGINNLQYNNIIINNFKSNLEIVDSDLKITNIDAQANLGQLLGEIHVKDIFTSKKISSDLNIKNFDTNILNKKLKGLVDADIKINGDLLNPDISSNIKVTNLFYNDYVLGDGSFNAKCDLKKCDFVKFFIYGSLCNIESEKIHYDINTQEMNGELLVNNFELNTVLKSVNNKIFGFIQGKIALKGTLNKPYIIGNFLAQDVIFAKNKLGMGPLKLVITHDELENSKEKDLVFSLSTQLKDNYALSSLQLSYAYFTKRINAQANIENLPITSLKINKNLPKINGILSAKLLASGDIDNPFVNIDSYLNNVFLDNQNKEKNLFGPIISSFSLKEHNVNINACASLSFNTKETICSEKMDIALVANGTLKNKLLDLELESNFFIPNVENFLVNLKKDFATLSATGNIKSHIKYDESFNHETHISIEELSGSMPNIPNINLGDSLEITINNDDIFLSKTAKILFYPGLFQVSGGIYKENINLSLNGDAPLAITKFFLPFIQKAEGFAKGNLSIKGILSKPILDGSIIFTKNAKIFPKKWVQPITPQGSLKFSPYGKGFVISAEKINLLVGNGNLVISSKFLNSYGENKDLFDLSIKGKNIVLSDNNDFIEGDFNISIIQDQNEQKIIKGDIVINDGYALRKFNLKNFIANVASSYKTSSFNIPIDAKLDLSLLINRFVFDAKMLNIDINTVINGQVYSNSTLSSPKFTGNLFIKEGQIVFPSTSFDLVDTQINLDENSNKVFDPIIELSSVAELSHLDFPILSKDTSIEMSLNGSLDKLDLSFKPISGDVKLSQLKIFLLLLSPKALDGIDSSGENVLFQGAKNAALMLSKEMFLRPLTEEIQDLIEGKTYTKIQFGSSIDDQNINLSLLWKLGARIEFEGNYNYKRQKNEKKLGINEFVIDADDVLGNIKINLLLLDHKPFGPLFFQTSFGAIDVKEGSLNSKASIKLIYRIFDK